MTVITRANGTVDLTTGFFPPCRAATTGSNIVLAGLQTIDTVALNAGDRVLVKDQTDPKQNGIYAASTGNWVRTADAQSNTQFFQGMAVVVALGLTNSLSSFMCTATDDPVVVGTSSLTWTRNFLAGATSPTAFTARQTYSYSPVTFDLGSGQFAANMVFNATGITVPANKTFNFISIRQGSGATNKFTTGAGGIGSGIWVDIESTSSSDVASNLYAGVFHVTNSGPGTVKGIHADTIAKTGSTGPMCAVNCESQPVSTTGLGTSCVQLSIVQDAGVADGVVTGIFPISVANNDVDQGSQFLYVIGSPIRAIPVKTAFFQAWMAASSAAGARAFTTWNDAGAEIQYIKSTGEVVSSTALIAGTESNGINVTQSAITRNNAAGSISIAAGTGSGILQLLAGGNLGIQIAANGQVEFGSSASFSANASVATALGSVGPVGSHTSVQGWLTILDNTATARYIPCF